jgi:hypothetical protein
MLHKSAHAKEGNSSRSQCYMAAFARQSWCCWPAADVASRLTTTRALAWCHKPLLLPRQSYTAGGSGPTFRTCMLLLLPARDIVGCARFRWSFARFAPPAAAAAPAHTCSSPAALGQPQQPLAQRCDILEAFHTTH